MSEREDPGFGPPVPETSYIATADALEISGQGNVGLIVAQARNADSVDRAVSGIKESLTAAHGGAEDFSVTTQQELLSAFTDITDQLQVFLIGIAGISLLVGGIGVMNIMLVSVSERTREIGVRKAVGATDLDVLLQFLFEAVLLSLIGGFARHCRRYRGRDTLTGAFGRPSASGLYRTRDRPGVRGGRPDRRGVRRPARLPLRPPRSRRSPPPRVAVIR